MIAEKVKVVEDSAGEPTTRMKQIYEKVLNVMVTSHEIYNSDFSISTLADLVGEPYYEVSGAINCCYGNNFKTLLNDHRIQKACRLLGDENISGRQTIESIAESLGFKSRTYFNAIFKKYTGLTPTVYIGLSKVKS